MNKTRVYEVELSKGTSSSYFQFAADNKELAVDHAEFGLGFDESFVAEKGYPVENSVRFIGFAETEDLDEEGNFVTLERLY